MKLLFPPENLVARTSEVDYANWNYQFLIKYIQRYRFKSIIKLIGDRKFNNLLEAGTGSGIFLPELKRHCNNLYACDIHDRIDVVSDLASKCNLDNCFISKQSIQETSYPDNYFDGIVAISTLEFVDDLRASIAEIRRILSPDGHFYTICPMESSFLDIFLSFYTDKKPEEEFGNARQFVTNELESNFKMVKKGTMNKLSGSLFPVYTYYDLKK
ncbi:class I SAM-dependent methyltransferase [Saccharicrinis sp. FJH62]|uniref:class I SAM-dependent methyltransferase n=1 Tax=Saccharicrinis sp. FJH62 TaxID=3344657 RepID=UPI0035D51F6D